MNKCLKLKTLAFLLAACMLAGCGSFSPDDITLSADGEPVKSTGGGEMIKDFSSYALFKAKKEQNNPLLTNIFCADPTAVEYNGRLYVYGTNDNQQYIEKGKASNTYERIKSFVIISTDDMVNWRYEGEINTGEIAPWIYASWAPSVVKREEADGLTHFYLYFSNSGAGVGVLTSTDPIGPWTDPLGKPLIDAGMDGLEDCPSPFDPGACIDGDGTGWLSFGGGMASDGTSFMPGVARICRLGDDMISIASEFAKIPAPYFFEASELNYINDTFVYTYNTSWENRDEWDDRYGVEAPPACSMCYMTSKTPLDSESWEYKDYYLKNPGELSMDYSNNHSHIEKYEGKYYVFFHTLLLQKARRMTQGFRSLSSFEVQIDEDNVVISECEASAKGTEQIKKVDAYSVNSARTAWLTDCKYTYEGGNIYVHCTDEDDDVIAVKGVDFKKGSRALAVKVKGKGTIELKLDSADTDSATVISFECDDWTVVYNDDVKIKDTHDVFFIMSGEFDFDEWQFVK